VTLGPLSVKFDVGSLGRRPWLTALTQQGHKTHPARADIVNGMTLTVPQRHRPPVAINRSGPVLDVVIPVHNEERDLEPCVRHLHAYLSEHFPYTFRITIADNASTDDTLGVALALERELPEVLAVHMIRKGRGRALH